MTYRQVRQAMALLPSNVDRSFAAGYPPTHDRTSLALSSLRRRVVVVRKSTFFYTIKQDRRRFFLRKPEGITLL
jgi:hypothetical protein